MPVIDAGAPTGTDPKSSAVTEILSTVATLTPTIRRAFLTHREASNTENPSGEQQLRADKYVDRLLEERLLALSAVGEYASEEREGVAREGEGLSVAVDPLDGSGNLTSNNGVGTVIGIYDDSLPATGDDIIASACVTYGPTTVMMTARNGTVTEYMLDSGAATVLRSDVTIPDEPTIFALGGREWEWNDGFRTYAEEVRNEYKLRYTGAVIVDLFRILSNGGVYAYPSVESYPQGKPRHQFEAVPISYMVEAAGGRSSNGNGSVLDAEVDGIHERTPLCIGNEQLVARFEQLQ